MYCLRQPPPTCPGNPVTTAASNRRSPCGTVQCELTPSLPPPPSLCLSILPFPLFPRSKKTDFGPHDWHSMPVSGAQTWLVVPGLEPGTEYQFSVLAQNKLGTGPFSEVVTVNTAGGSFWGLFSFWDVLTSVNSYFYASTCQSRHHAPPVSTFFLAVF